MIAPWNVKSFLEITRLRDTVADVERQRDRAEHDLGLLRADFARLVEQVGNFATRPRIGSVLDADPYKETDAAIEWLTPSDDEVSTPPVKNGDE